MLKHCEAVVRAAIMSCIPSSSDNVLIQCIVLYHRVYVCMCGGAHVHGPEPFASSVNMC